jgi:putative FmdB family regulatory protein
MPLYEFVCGKCNNDFELLVRSAKWEGTAECPHCGSKKLTKKLSVFASAVASDSGPLPCERGACGLPQRQRQRSAGCGCCGPHHHD